MIRCLLGAVASLSLALATTPTHAQPYPSKPVRMIVPVAGGGMTDIVARQFAQKLGERLGQPVVAENRSGAGGNIGTEAVARAAPDGYTLLFAYPGPIVVNPSIFRNLPYDPVRDLAPVSMLGTYPMMLAVGPSLPVKSVAELIEHARRNPGKLDYASAGNATTAHLAMELFRREVGIEVQHIPYKGSAPGLTDLLGGRIALAFDSIPVLLPHHNAGRLRALAVSSQARSPAAPGIPGMAEAGVKNVDVFGWFGIFVPAGTPRPIIDRLSRDFIEIMKDAEVAKSLLARSMEPRGTTPEALAELVRTELDTWARVIRQAGIKPD